MKKIDDKFILDNIKLFEHKKAVIIVGAGISVASGIPDFRSENGIFASLKKELKINGKELFNYQFGVKPETRKIYLSYISNLKKLCDNAKPNKTHEFLKNFPKSTVYTQNIDGLEEKAGVSFTKAMSTQGVYLHGNLETLSCQYCSHKIKFEYPMLLDGKEIECEQCIERNNYCIKNNIRKRPIGLMHPSIIHYNQVHPDAAFIGKKADHDSNADLLIVIGTSLSVDGIKKLVKYFCRLESTKERRILVNLTKPRSEWSTFFDYFYEGDCNSFVQSYENAIEQGNIQKTKKTPKPSQVVKVRTVKCDEKVSENDNENSVSTEQEATVALQKEIIRNSRDESELVNMTSFNIKQGKILVQDTNCDIDTSVELCFNDKCESAISIDSTQIERVPISPSCNYSNDTATKALRINTDESSSNIKVPSSVIDLDQVQDRIEQIHSQIKRLSITQAEYEKSPSESRFLSQNKNDEITSTDTDDKDEAAESEKKKMTFEAKLKEISRTFSDEELLEKDILGECIRNTTETQVDTSESFRLEDDINVLKKQTSATNRLSLTPRKIKKKK